MMADKNKSKCMIFKRESKRNLEGMMFEDKQLTVEGDNMEEVKKVFDEKWKK